VCGKSRDQEHDWSKDCEKCANCGATRKDSHRIEGCQCSICGSQFHNWGADTKVGPMLHSHSCKRCGKSERSVIIDPRNPDDLDAFMRVFGFGGR
jgi:hypothetical protein